MTSSNHPGKHSVAFHSSKLIETWVASLAAQYRGDPGPSEELLSRRGMNQALQVNVNMWNLTTLYPRSLSQLNYTALLNRCNKSDNIRARNEKHRALIHLHHETYRITAVCGYPLGAAREL